MIRRSLTDFCFLSSKTASKIVPCRYASIFKSPKTPSPSPSDTINDLYNNLKITKDRFGYVATKKELDELPSERGWKESAPLPPELVTPPLDIPSRNMRKPSNQSPLKLIKFLKEDREKIRSLFDVETKHNVCPIEYKSGLLRCGLIGRKQGETTLFLRNGKTEIGTVIEIPENQVFSCEPWYGQFREQTGLKSLKVVAFDHEKIDEVPLVKQKDYFSVGISPKQAEKDFYVSKECSLPIGFKLDLTHFSVGQYVDISGMSINRGYQGVMIRWGYKGQGYSRGRTKTHRRPGAISTQGLARVLKGKKMPGIMGNRKLTQKGIHVVYANYERNYIIVRGSVLGCNGSFLNIADSILKAPIQAPLLFYPTYVGDRGCLGREIYDSTIIGPHESLKDLLAEKLVS